MRVLPDDDRAPTTRAADPAGRPRPPEALLASLDAVVPLALGNANVIMQLALLPVGRGVAESPVESGRVDKHPIKRLRTTMSFLAIAILGTEDERRNNLFVELQVWFASGIAGNVVTGFDVPVALRSDRLRLLDLVGIIGNGFVPRVFLDLVARLCNLGLQLIGLEIGAETRQIEGFINEPEGESPDHADRDLLTVQKQNAYKAAFAF